MASSETSSKPGSRPRGLRRGRSLALRLAVAGAALAVALLLLETLLRVAPAAWPTGSFGVGRFDSELGLNVHAATAVYNKVRWVRRSPNRSGFLDANHDEEKPPGVLRVGFFGDSYVEALQVPLESTFYRLLPGEIAGSPVESLGFGISGWGTLHSLMAYRVLGSRYDLDVVAYVFVKNDPGDQYYSLQSARRGRVTVKPSAELSEHPPGFVVHRPDRGDRQPGWRRLKRAVDAHSMLARVVRGQLLLMRATLGEAEDRGPRDATRPPDTPNQNDLPSDWPPVMLSEARELTRRVLARFRDEVVGGGRQFVVLYVPRGNEELDGQLAERDIWLPWLRRTCAELGVALIDPTEALRAGQSAATPMYDDHWSPRGHAVIASEVESYLRDLLASDPAAVAHELLP